MQGTSPTAGSFVERIWAATDNWEEMKAVEPDASVLVMIVMMVMKILVMVIFVKCYQCYQKQSGRHNSNSNSLLIIRGFFVLNWTFFRGQEMSNTAAVPGHKYSLVWKRVGYWTTPAPVNKSIHPFINPYSSFGNLIWYWNLYNVWKALLAMEWFQRQHHRLVGKSQEY